MPTQLFEPRQEARPSPPPSPPAVDVVRRLDRLMDTTNEVYLTACRLILGGIMLAHATQKIFGWFGGQGFPSTIQSFRDHLGIPLFFAVLAILAETLGAVSLILGFLGRLGAFCVIAVMVGAVLIVHAQHGFFMNWTGKGTGEGYEYHLLAIGLALPILVKGSGAFSVDNGLVRELRKNRTEAA